MQILYITHYSIMEPLGQSQILPYLTGLARRGHAIEILSFEKQALLADLNRFRLQNESLQDCGIGWYPRTYRGGSSAGKLLADVFRTARELNRRCARRRIDLIHCRAHVPFLMAWFPSALRRIPVLFDFRGFITEEYVDAGLWKADGIQFRLIKRLERKMAHSSSAMVVLTNPVRDYISDTYGIPAGKLFVIPCCVDLQRFLPDGTPTSRAPGRPLRVVYSGSTDGRYDLPAMLRFFSLLRERRPGSHFTILSTGDLARVQGLVEKASVPCDSVTVKTLPHHQVPSLLSEQDLGLFFLRGGLTLLAASPTKIGEYLASGLPVVAEKGIGGLEEILEDQGVGHLARSDQPETLQSILDAALQLCDRGDTRLKAIQTAGRYYSLERGIEAYAKTYEYAVRSTASEAAKTGTGQNS